MNEIRPPLIDLPLFVYGTLADPSVFSVITGEIPYRAEATLPAYEKLAPAESFPYVIPCEGAEVRGFLVAHLRPESFALLDRYEDEGRLYVRREVTVHTAEGPRRAQTYLAGPELLGITDLDDVDVDERLTDFVRSRIESALAAELPARSRIRELNLRARKELLGDEIEELVRETFERPAITNFAITRQLAAAQLPTLTWLEGEPAARTYAPAYLELILKAIVFNQLEERIHQDFRGAVRVADPYFEHGVSALAALRYGADNLGPLGDMAVALGVDAYNPLLEYVDYAVAAIFIADELYTRERVRPYVERIKDERARGGVPLGVELEFSPLGPAAIGALPDDDPRFDGFYYFDDFDLGGRFWKLGGHVDDHSALLEGRGRVRGFLELAVGRLKVLDDLSRPVTADPVILSGLANAAVAYLEIKPHSLHISVQLERGRPFGPPPALGDLICLLILGGDLGPDEDGRLRERRIFNGEIVDELAGLSFSRLNEHRGHPYEDEGTAVAAFDFPRLFYEHSYLDLILALKGFQLADNPPPLELSSWAPYHDANRELAEALAQWAADPRPVGATDQGAFLARLERGLTYEATQLEGHDLVFRRTWLQNLEVKLAAFNAFLASGGDERKLAL